MTYKILILEDSSEDAEIISKLLNQENLSFEIKITLSKQEYIAALNDFKPDIILADYNMHDFNGLDALDMCKKKHLLTPFIFISGFMSAEQAIEALTKGASDYVFKDRLTKLAPIIKRVTSELEQSFRVKRIEEEVRNSERKYHYLFEASSDAIVLVKNDTVIDCNTAFSFFSYRPKSKIIGLKLEEIFLNLFNNDHQSNDRFLKNLHQAFIGKKSSFKIELSKTPDKRIIFNISSDKIEINDEDIYQVILRDVTNEEISRYEIEKSELRYRQLFDNNPAAVFRTTLEGKILDTNNALIRILGYDTAEEIKKHNVREFYVNNKNRDEFIRGLLRNRIVNNYDVNFRKKDGTIISVMINAGIYDDVISGQVVIQGAFIDISEEKKYKERLTESEKFFKNIVDNIPHMIFVKEARALSFVDINKAGEELLGISKNEIVGKTDFEIIAKEYAESYRAKDKIVLSDKKLVDIPEEKVVAEGNEVRILHTKKIPILDDNGIPKYLLGISEDITERKNKEEELLMLANAIQSITQAVSITDINNKLIFVNKSFLDLYGYTEDELIGKDINIVGENENALIINKKILEQTFNGGWEGELVNRKKDGTLFTVHLTTSVVVDDNKNTIALIGVATDVTERNAAEEVRKRLAAIVRSSEDAIIGKNSNGNITSWNRGAEKIFGYTEDEVKNKPIGIIVPEDLLDEENNILQKVITGNAVENYETVRKCKNGHNINVAITISPITDMKGRTIGISTVARDITKQKMQEAELIAAKERAEEMNKLKSFFLANMSHELRTPMIGILGYSELLMEEVDDNTQKEMVGTINTSGKRLLETLNMILDLSKIESGKVEVKYAKNDVTKIIMECVRLHEINIKNKNLSISTEFEKKPFFMYTDETLLNKIIEHLISNAVKFTHKGGINIKLYNESNGKENYDIIEISDTGIGIPDRYHKIIFEEFRQVSEGYDRNFEGSGLGLSITKRLVDLLKGEINVISEINNGTSFKIKFPDKLKSKEINNGETMTNDSNDNEVMEESGEKLEIKPRILVVEDDETTIKIVSLFLSKDYTLDFEKSGQSAIEKACATKYDIILLDINLGKGLSGIDVAKELKKQKNYTNTPFIAFTAFAMAGDKEEFLKSGCTHYLSKPFSKKQLFDVLAEAYKN